MARRNLTCPTKDFVRGTIGQHGLRLAVVKVRLLKARLTNAQQHSSTYTDKSSWQTAWGNLDRSQNQLEHRALVFLCWSFALSEIKPRLPHAWLASGRHG
ncbi:unnamed protein product [Effrenium voratum]|nr:unnamed protein product [Effrenium voratum]